MNDNKPDTGRDRTIKSIRRTANIGLWGSLLLSAAVVAEHYLDLYVWKQTITTDEYTRHRLLMFGLILSVVDIALILFFMRREVPRMRQLDSIDEKLQKYRGLTRTINIVTLIVVLMVGAVIVISHENILIMLLLLIFVTLMLNFPNMYKMKSNMGLTDDEMTELFGASYIKGGEGQQ